MLHREVSPRQTNEFSLKFSSVRHRGREVDELMEDRQPGWHSRADDDCMVRQACESHSSAMGPRTEQARRFDVFCVRNPGDPIQSIIEVHRSRGERSIDFCFRSIDVLGVGVTSHVVAHLASPTLRDHPQRRTTRRAGLQRMHPPNSHQTSDPWSGREPRHTWSPSRGRTDRARRGRCPS